MSLMENTAERLAKRLRFKPPNLNLNSPHGRGPSSLWSFEMQFESLLQVVQGLLFGFALTGDINLQAL